jgi:uncharacterized protein YjfI (DUF2170 family)
VKESLSIAGLNCCCLDIAIVKDCTKAVDTGMIHCIIYAVGFFLLHLESEAHQDAFQSEVLREKQVLPQFHSGLLTTKGHHGSADYHHLHPLV